MFSEVIGTYCIIINGESRSDTTVKDIVNPLVIRIMEQVQRSK